MCDPGTAIVLTSLAITLAGAQAIVSGVSASNQAESQNQYQAALATQRNQQIAENNRLAQEAYLRQANQENLQLNQEQAKAGQDITKNTILAEQARARVRTAAGESGVAGLSVDGLLADYDRQEAVFADSVQANLENKYLQSSFNKEGYKAQAEGRAASISPYLPQKVQGPSFIGTALQAGVDMFGAGVSAYSGMPRGYSSPKPAPRPLDADGRIPIN